MQGKDIVGYYTTASGDSRDFRAKFLTRDEHPSRSSSSDTILIESKFTYPFMAYGTSHLPETKTYLIKNTTVWTNTEDGILKNSDVLLKNGKIEKIGSIEIGRASCRERV